MATVAQTLAQTQARGLSRLDTQLLLLHALGREPSDRAWLLTHDQALIDEAAGARFEHAVARRLADWPVAYLLGHKEFFGSSFEVGPGVLVPRPDTETLVDWALACAPPAPAPIRVLDLGTGSGAIAVSLARALGERASVCAVEASEAAAVYARRNIAALAPRVELRMGHWFEALGCTGAAVQESGPFDIIVSNPPYVAEGDSHLAALAVEPRSALTAGTDGLDDIRTLVIQAAQHLCRKGWLLLEHGHDQGAAVRNLLVQAGWADVQSRTDLAGIERCSGGRRSG